MILLIMTIVIIMYITYVWARLKNSVITRRSGTGRSTLRCAIPPKRRAGGFACAGNELYQNPECVQAQVMPLEQLGWVGGIDWVCVCQLLACRGHFGSSGLVAHVHRSKAHWDMLFLPPAHNRLLTHMMCIIICIRKWKPMCVCICIYVYIYIYVYTYIHTCMHAYIYIYICIHTNMCICICVYICVYLYTCIYTHRERYTQFK